MHKSKNSKLKNDGILPNRKSLRLPDYDYSQPGAYFITVGTQGRRCLFGEIENGTIKLSILGQIAEKVWENLPERFPNIICDNYIIMPNHIHGIIEIVAAGLAPAREIRSALVAAGLAPALRQSQGLPLQHTIENFTNVLNAQNQSDPVGAGLAPVLGQPQGLPLHQPNECKELPPRHTIGDMVGAYKSLVANECMKIFRVNNNNKTLGKLWQRNYYEHVIRDERDYEAIVDYIQTNPDNWERDEEFSKEPEG